jgi:hypothetical protein
MVATGLRAELGLAVLLIATGVLVQVTELS